MEWHYPKNCLLPGSKESFEYDLKMYRRVRRVLFDELSSHKSKGNLPVRTRVRLAADFAVQEDAAFSRKGSIAKDMMNTAEFSGMMRAKGKELKQAAGACKEFQEKALGNDIFLDILVGNLKTAGISLDTANAVIDVIIQAAENSSGVFTPTLNENQKTPKGLYDIQLAPLLDDLGFNKRGRARILARLHVIRGFAPPDADEEKLLRAIQDRIGRL